MPTRFIYQGAQAAAESNGSNAGIGVENGVLYINPSGTRRPVSMEASYGVTYYVDPQLGADTNSGKSWGAAFASFDALDDVLAHGDTILFRGVYKGNWVTPYKNDVTLRGVANTPRQATDDGVANGAGATWLSLASPAASPLLKVMRQGWTVENIYFNNADTANPAVLLFRDAATPEADASHAAILGCKFTGTDDGLKQSGGVNFVKVLGNTFFNFTGSGDIAISSETGAGVGVGLGWEIAYNFFYDNVHNIIVPLNVADIHDNMFVVVGHTTTSTSVINMTGGAHNIVRDNTIGRVSNASPNTTLFVDGTDCIWANNKMSDTAKYGIPVNS